MARIEAGRVRRDNVVIWFNLAVVRRSLLERKNKDSAMRKEKIKRDFHLIHVA